MPNVSNVSAAVFIINVDDDDRKTYNPNHQKFAFEIKTTRRDKITTFKRFNHSITQTVITILVISWTGNQP